MASGKEYTTDRIRNIAVVGHGGSGKTSLVDALCFVSGTSKRHGSVDDGTALTMHTPEEHAHGIRQRPRPRVQDETVSEALDHEPQIVRHIGHEVGDRLLGPRRTRTSDQGREQIERLLHANTCSDIGVGFGAVVGAVPASRVIKVPVPWAE